MPAAFCKKLIFESARNPDAPGAHPRKQNASLDPLDLSLDDFVLACCRTDHDLRRSHWRDCDTFRRRGSRIRPYLGTGVGVVHLTSTREQLIASSGAPSPPPLTFSSTGPVFRSHVGIDLRLARKLDFRYSFSEMIGQNEISKHLAPPAPRGLENFQNLFGFIVRF